MIKEVSRYLTDILKPKLSMLGVSPRFIGELSESVEKQMLSALCRWNDEPFKKTLMLLVSEEAPFYRPDAPLDVKSFVVLTLRNSPFESLQSNAYTKTGLNKPLTDQQLIKLTSDAVSYFKNINLSDLAIGGENSEDENIYTALSEEYSVAWHALTNLANCPNAACDFAPATRKDVNEFSKNIERPYVREMNQLNNYIDGFDGEMPVTLAQQLKYLKDNRAAFFADSFKMITRNPELLLKVLEYLLINDLTFVSCNYLIKNGRAEKRKNTIKAAHSHKEVLKHLTNTSGISPEHRKFLATMRREMAGDT